MANASAPASPFAFFVQSVPPNEQGEHGHVVPRFGVRDTWLGVRRATLPPPRDAAESAERAVEERRRLLHGKPKGAPGWVWSEEPEGITHAEYAKYRREYEQAFEARSLVRLKPEDARAAARKAEKDEADRVAAEAEKAEKAKKEAEKPKPPRVQAAEESGR